MAGWYPLVASLDHLRNRPIAIVARKTVDPDEYRQREFDPLERAEVRDGLESRRFWRRVGHTLAVWSAWIVGVGAGIAFLGAQASAFVRWVAERMAGGGGTP